MKKSALLGILAIFEINASYALACSFIRRSLPRANRHRYWYDTPDTGPGEGVSNFTRSVFVHPLTSL